MKHFCKILSPKPEDDLLFACTRQQFDSFHRSSLAQISKRRPIDWGEIYSTAVGHGVAPLVYTNLSKCPELIAQIPPHVRHCFAECTRKNQLVQAIFAERARDILRFFARHSVQVMLIKGFALNRTIYREPWYTLTADIDVMISSRWADFPAADREDAYQLEIGRNPLEQRMGVEYGWFEHHDVSMDGLLPVDFAAIWKEARSFELKGQPALMMSPEHLLLAACINSCRKRFFRLKALCDISEIILSQRIDWTKFVDTAKEWRSEIIAYTALQAVTLTLGCTVPSSLSTELGVHSARRRVIRFLAERQSFSTLAGLSGTGHFLGRHLGLGLLLPFATYNIRQLWSNVKLIAKDAP